MSRRPSDYRPPVRVGEFVSEPEAAPDERIDVGALFVGGGPGRAGRRGAPGPAAGRGPGDRRAAGRDPDRAGRQGPAGRQPPAVRRRRQPVGTARPAAGHRPRLAARLLRAGQEGGRVRHAARGCELRIPTPPPFHNKGNLVFSRQPARPPPGRAGRGARRDGAARDRRPEAAGVRRRRARHPHRRQGPRPRGRAAERRSSPASRSTRRRRSSSEGTQGHLAGAAIERFGLQGRYPQVWSLGVKEVWRVPKAARPRDPHARLAVPAVGQVARGGRQLDLSDGQRHDLARAWSAASTTGTPACRCTTCCSCSRRTR